MRTIGFTFAASALLALPQLADAQVKIQINGQNVQLQNAQPIRLGVPGNLKIRLLQIKDVQEELKMSDEQTGKVDDFFKKQLANAAAPKTADEFQKRVKEVSEAADKALPDILKAEQIKRLDQLDLQRQGVNSPKAIEALKITDDQKAKFKDIQLQARKDMGEIFKNAKQNGEDFQKKLAEHQAKIKDKMADVLSPEQKTTWKEMTGEPFKGKLGGYPFGGFGTGAVLPIQIKPVEKKNIQ